MINIIAAIAKNKVIGKQGSTPWNIPEEFNLFQKITAGGTIIMGRKTYDAIGRGMLNRKNIVLSRKRKNLPGVEVCAGVKESLERAKSYQKDIFVIGGAQVFSLFFPFADKMYLSFLKKEYAGDTYFPKFNKEGWSIKSRKDYPEFELVVYIRKKKNKIVNNRVKTKQKIQKNVKAN